MSTDNFYRAFEDKYRGSRELIKSRLQVYLPFIKKIQEIDAAPKAIDLGCGRGEWLELLNENGYMTHGVDLDQGMLEACINKGFDVVQKDLLAALREQENESLWIVSGFHIVEHLPFELLQELVQESFRVLKPGGFLIMETPNPENIKVSTANFYLDPTHVRPLPPQLLSFLPEHYGFERTKVLRLQENRALHSTDAVTLSDVINGVSPDYAIVSQKSASSEILKNFEELFAKDYGLSLDVLLGRFETRLIRIEQNANEANAKAAQAEHSANEANAKAAQAEQNAIEAWHHYAMVVNSNSWKLTKPLRFVGKFIRWFFRGSYHWLTFSPTSRPRRIVKQKLVSIKYYINARPVLKNKIMRVLDRFPVLKARLKNIHYAEFDYSALTSTRNNKELLIDITHVYTEDLKTGIQRVVRSILNEFQKNEQLKDFDIQPVYLTDKDGFWVFKYVQAPDVNVAPQAKDIFLGLDFNAAVTEASYAGLFTDWKSRGVQICFVVYDILPILHPHWWYDGVSQAHEEWLKTVISYSDKVFCISQTVSNDVKKYITQYPSSIQNKPSIDWFHLGADVDNSVPSKGIPENAEAVLNQFGSKPSFLMVATVEPRKGHEQTLIAFEKLWADQVDVNLVIVGKAGWLVNDLVQKIRRHIELNKRLFWLEAISDEYLEKVYAASTCLIAASEGEGFGLPLIEAAQHKLPIIARDITVFREVAGEHAYYFPNDSSPEVLTDVVKEWLELNKGNLNPKSDNMPWLTWAQSAQKITELMMLNNSKI